MEFEWPNIPYAQHSLEPHTETNSMELNHIKHHQGYISNFNKSVEGTDLYNNTITKILKNQVIVLLLWIIMEVSITATPLYGSYFLPNE